MPPEMLLAILLLPATHYLADFELQTNSMAIGKSKSLKWLTLHVSVYSIVFMMLFGWRFGVVTFATHFATDFWTSRWSSRKWPFVPLLHVSGALRDRDGEGGRSRHGFFCVVGLDQMIHSYTLLLTVFWLKPEVFVVLKLLGV